MDKANSVGLSDYYKNLVQNGSMSIEDVTDDTLKEQIQTYKEYYEKALAASDAVQDLRDNLAELAKTKFDNLAKKFENELDLMPHSSNHCAYLPDTMAHLSLQKCTPTEASPSAPVCQIHDNPEQTTGVPSYPSTGKMPESIPA